MTSRMRSRVLCFVVLAGLAFTAGPRAQGAVPGIDDLLNLKRVGSPAISPDGRSVAYTVRETNWDDNEYETEIWVGSQSGTRQLTSGKKSSLQPAWSPDGKWLAFISDRTGKRQLFRIALGGGEAEELTRADEGVNAFAWAPDGGRICMRMAPRRNGFTTASTRASTPCCLVAPWRWRSNSSGPAAG